MSAPILAAVLALVPQDAEASPGDRLVKVELLADRAAVRPGEAFALAVRLKIDRGWHVYWENHGDSGVPTHAEIAAPPGFEVGPLRFPGPERHVAEGDVQSFVHHGELVLLADVRAPAALPAGSAALAFDVDADWLVCQEVCYPGSGAAKLELPAAAADDRPAPANEAFFTAARARLPRPWSELPGARIAWSERDGSPVATIAVPRAADLDFFPYADETTSLASTSVERAEDACRLAATLRFQKREPADLPRLAGVLRVRQGERESFFRVDSPMDLSR